MLLRYGVKVYRHAAHQGHDDVTAQQVVVGQAIATINRQNAIVQRLVIPLHGPHGLAVTAPHLPNGRHTKPHHVAFGTGGVALEVTVQAAVHAGAAQFVVGQCEVVEAYVYIAGIQKTARRHQENLQALFGTGKFFGFDQALRLEALWQMRVVIQGDALGTQTYDVIQRAPEAIQRLARQAVDQVKVDGAKTIFAAAFQGLLNHFQWLDTVNRFLHIRVKVLHAKTGTVKAHVSQGGQAGVANGARVDFDTDFGVFGKLKALAQHIHQALQAGVVAKGGRATAQMQLTRQAMRAQMGFDQRHFLFKVVKIFDRARRILCDNFVARTKVAQRLTKRQVHIHRQRRCLDKGSPVGRVLQVSLLAKLGIEPVGRGVRGVAWAGGIKTPNE